jgi:hypothetical protein
MGVDWGKVLESINGCRDKTRVGWTVRTCTHEAFRNMVVKKYGSYAGTLYGHELEQAMIQYMKKEGRALLRELRKEQLER